VEVLSVSTLAIARRLECTYLAVIQIDHMLLLEHDRLQDSQHTHPIGGVGDGSVAELILHRTAIVLLEGP